MKRNCQERNALSVVQIGLTSFHHSLCAYSLKHAPQSCLFQRFAKCLTMEPIVMHFLLFRSKNFPELGFSLSLADNTTQGTTGTTGCNGSTT